MLVSQIIVTLAEYVHISAFHYHFSILSFSIFFIFEFSWRTWIKRAAASSSSLSYLFCALFWKAYAK